MTHVLVVEQETDFITAVQIDGAKHRHVLGIRKEAVVGLEHVILVGHDAEVGQIAEVIHSNGLGNEADLL